MMRVMVLLIVGLVIAPVAARAQVGPPDRDRRTELEQRVRRQFLDQLAQRLELTETQRDQVREVLSASAEARQDLALEGQALRIDLMQAVRDDDASMDRFDAILDRLEAIRERERGIEEDETEALREILDARQQAVFLFMRMQFNDRVRQMRGGRGGPGGVGMGPGGPMHPGMPGPAV